MEPLPGDFDLRLFPAFLVRCFCFDCLHDFRGIDAKRFPNPEEGLQLDTSNSRAKGKVQERQVKISLTNMHSYVDLNTLESIVDVAQFEDEIGQTYALRLGAETQAKSIKKTFFVRFYRGFIMVVNRILLLND